MTHNCRAAVLREAGLSTPYAQSQPLQIETVTLQPPGPTEVLCKIAGAGLCHSDLSIINGSRARALPMAMGHEGAGEVIECGAAVRDLVVGQTVVFQFSANCGRCVACQQGRPQICPVARAATAAGELMSGGSRITDADGRSLAHHAGVSCFAEYAVVDRGSIVPVDTSLPLADLAIFGCAVMTGAGAVINTARIRAGDTVAIIGLGGVGLSGLLGARLAGAETIVAIDVAADKLEMARQLGASHTLLATDSQLTAKVLDLTGGGVDYAIDLAGAVAAMQTAWAITRRGGAVVSAGLAPDGASFSFLQSELVSQEKSILGSYMGSCVPLRDIPRFIALCEQGRLPVDRLIDGHLTLAKINQGFDRLAAGDALRQVLVP